MVARVVIFEGVDVAAARERLGEVESIIGPMVEGLAGYRGRLDLVAADGRHLSITLFDSEDDADAAEPTFDEEMPRRLGEHFESWEGRRASVERYEVLIDRRA